MPVLAADVAPDTILHVYAIKEDLLSRPASFSVFSGAYPMKRFAVGDASYELRHEVVGWLYPVVGGGYEFVVNALAEHVVGRGNTAVAARDDWYSKVHALAQRLLRARPFEMTDLDAAQWRAVESIIDVSHYRRATPVRMRQLGRVEYVRGSFPQAVHWVGARREAVTLDKMPPEFAGFKVGQWIEAVCERDPLSGRLRRVTHVEPIPEVRLMSLEEQSKYWDQLPTSSSLPESDLDWTQPTET